MTQKNMCFKRSIVAIAGIIGVVALLAIVGQAQAATHYVDPGDSIQDAINAASDGDNIIVNDSTYTENIIVNQTGLAIQSNNGSVSCIVDAGGAIGINITVNNTLVEGFTVRNGSRGISVHNDSFTVKNVTIDNCTIYNCTYDFGYGIYCDGVTESTINNTQVNDTRSGVYLSSTSYSNITGNNITSNSQEGIHLYESDNNNITGNNTIYSNTAHGIWLYNSDGNNISGNSIYDNSNGIMLSGTGNANNDIYYNNIYDNTDGIDSTSGPPSSTINATRNYWGDARGPYNPTTNPSTTGDSVIDEVAYCPWLDAAHPGGSPVGKVQNTNTGNYFCTIQDAIDAAVDGHIIKVTPGTYVENLVINREIQLIGDPIIDGAGGIAITVETNNTLVENMTITNCSTGIYVHNVSFTLQNVTLNNITVDTLLGPVDNGTIFENVNNSWMNDTRIYNASSFAAILDTSSNITIEQSNWSHNSHGVWASGSDNNVIRDNGRCIDNNQYGIYLMGSDGNRIRNTDFMSNTIFYGIYLQGSDNNIIENTNCSNNGKAGIYVSGGSTGNQFLNNTFSSNGVMDLNVSSSPGNTFTNNTVSSYPTTFDVTSYSGNFNISGVDNPPAMPTGVGNISKFLNISLTGEWINVTICYEDANLVEPSNEDTMVIWKHNGTGPFNGWHKYGSWYADRGIDTVANETWVNITDSGSVFAPLQDTEAPQSSCTVAGPYWNNTGAVTVEWDASDNVNLSTVRIYLRHSPDNSSFGTWQLYTTIHVNGTSASGSQHVNLNHGEGVYQFVTNATDDAGNHEGITPYDDEIGYDDTPPVTTKIVGSPSYGPDNLWVNLSTDITLSAMDFKDNASGVAATYYRIWNSDGWHPNATDDSYCTNQNITVYNGTRYFVYYNASVDFGPIQFCEECEHQIEFYSVDNATNEETPHNIQPHNVDDTPPEVTKEYGQQNYVNGTGALFITKDTPIYLNATDLPEAPCNVSSYQIFYRVWSSTYGMSNWYNGVENESVEFNMSDLGYADNCTHYIEYYAVDDLGNNYTEPLNQTVYVDNVAPDFNVSVGNPNWTAAGPNAYFVTNHTPVWINATDNGTEPCIVESVNLTVTVEYEGGLIHDEWQYVEDGWASICLNPAVLFADNCTHYVNITAVDNLGNTAVLNYTFYVDNIAPDINETLGEPQYIVEGGRDILSEDFEGTFPPTEWTVINNGGNCVWQRNDVTGRTNYAGGNGYCAVADSDWCGSGTTMDTELWTPSFSLAGFTSATLEFIASYNYLSGSEYAEVDISTDGGSTWANLLHWAEDHDDYGPGELVTLDLTPYVGNSTCMIRFHYYAPDWDWYWEIDDVNISGKRPGAGTYITSDTPIWVNATDNGTTPECTVSSVNLTVDVYYLDGEIHTYHYDNVTDGWAQILFTIPEDCVHWINITAIDDLGNTAWHNQTVYVDNVAPDFNVTVGNPNWTAGPDAYYVTNHTPVWINATDNGTEPCIVGSVNLTVTIEYQGIEIYNVSDYVEYMGEWAHVMPDPADVFADNCTHYMNITAIDDLGNTALYTVVFYVDNVAPVSAIEQPDPYCRNVTDSNPLQINGSVVDLPDNVCASGVYNVSLWYRYARYNHSFTDWIHLATNTTEADDWQYLFTAPNGSGYYQFYTAAYDNLGNHELPPNGTSMPKALVSVSYNHSFDLYFNATRDKGWNWMTLPVKHPDILTASDLAMYINMFEPDVCNMISVWDPVGQMYRTYVHPYSMGTVDDFVFEYGQGFMVHVRENVTVYMEACLIEYDEIGFRLYDSWNVVGWTCLESTDMRQLGENVSDTLKLMSYDAVQQLYGPAFFLDPPPWAMGLPPESIAIGEAVFLMRYDPDDAVPSMSWQGGREFLALPPP